MKLITDLQKEENTTREEANKALPTLQAFAEGKVIQMLDDRSIWTDLTEREGLPIGTLGESPNIFRIKPESKYRPFANAEECWTECFYNIVSVSNIDVSMANVSGDIVTLYFSEVMEDNTFADGTPFGIKVE